MSTYNLLFGESPLFGGGVAAGKGAQRPGLVPIKTSRSGVQTTAIDCRFRFDPQPCKVPGAVEIDQHVMRLRRLRKNVITSARLMSDQLKGERGVRGAFVTLTYREDAEWSPDQISGYINAVKLYLRRRGLPARYVWVLELTKRGRPHYHVLWWLPKGVTLPKADKRGWWRHGMTKTEWARNPVGYLAKYASKGTSDADGFPKGARLYGVGGLGLLARLERAWWNLPVGVRSWGTPLDRWRRAPGGGWVCRSTGEWRESLWSVQLIGGRVFAYPKVRRWVIHHEAWFTAAPSIPPLHSYHWCPLVPFGRLLSRSDALRLSSMFLPLPPRTTA